MQLVRCVLRYTAELDPSQNENTNPRGVNTNRSWKIIKGWGTVWQQQQVLIVEIDQNVYSSWGSFIWTVKKKWLSGYWYLVGIWVLALGIQVFSISGVVNLETKDNVLILAVFHYFKPILYTSEMIMKYITYWFIHYCLW